ncbi:efflux RND transporter periplasmic adaptor subunit [Paracoccus contaminans]|uniref:efflux RND transporter periplasmic adaptor subunit n=1 Tax=Paracoccus contaminans TaxID=1945662 RepID=UPI001F0B6EF7|nr:efflux RND transporter periplasmic adaptor subunit [Paracoccus contaminans]
MTEFVTDTAQQERTIPGVIVAATEVQMAFQTLGRMIERPVDVGDRVRQGDLLARLDPEDLASTTRAAKAAVAAAEVNLETARNTAERARALARRNVASTAQLETAEQALTAAQSTVAQARAQLESARDAQSFAVMTAPIAGVISAVKAAPGAVVAAGDPIMTLSSEDRIEARIDLIEAQLRGVKPGTRFLVWRDSEGERPVAGTVTRIDPVADPQTRTRRVFITLPDDTDLRLGSLVRARAEGSGATRLTVPAGALVVTPAGSAVWQVTRQGEAASVALRPVQPGETAGGRTQILDGLKAGDEVVTRGVHSLSEGQAVGRRVDP